MKYVLHGQISDIYEETRKHWVSGTGPDAIFEVEHLGWRIVLFNASFSVGLDRPPLHAGDFVTLTIEGPLNPPKVQEHPNPPPPPSKETSNALDPRRIPPKAQQEVDSSAS